jgi:hypothetical protein
MYLAELHGKLSKHLQEKEDILTSNVFSFLKYANREVFLYGFLQPLGINVSPVDLNEAEFLFWPRFDDYTEPDLVILVGKFYLLVEAKYFSGFGIKTDKTEAQIKRELLGGKLESNQYQKDFRYIAVTADYCYKPEKFTEISTEDRPIFAWTNWQNITSMLTDALASNQVSNEREREFAEDLVQLLEQKNLRVYRGLGTIPQNTGVLNLPDHIYFNSSPIELRYQFIGYKQRLSMAGTIEPTDHIYWYCPRKFFKQLENVGVIEVPIDEIYFRRDSSCRNRN